MTRLDATGGLNDYKALDVPKVFVANRGEIAARVVSAARELGMSTIAIFSAEDTHSGYHRSK